MNAISGTYRVMLVEGTEVPDCFVPTGLHSVEPTNLVTVGKNLLQRLGPALPYTSDGITFSDNGDSGIRISGTATADTYHNFYTGSSISSQKLPAGDYTISLKGQVEGVCFSCGYFVNSSTNDYVTWMTTNVSRPNTSGTLTTAKYIRPYLFVQIGTTVDTVVYPQLELGSTATAYEPHDITMTPLPEVELRSLPDGTCDELVINADGACEVERRAQLVDGEVVALDMPTTEPQSPVTIPDLPAPTFNAYHDSQVPSDTSVEYERDINIVLANMEAVQTALLGGE